MIEWSFGRQTCGDLDEASRREWLVTDGLGGSAMGTVSGLRTRRYHGLLVVAEDPPRGRHLALAALDTVLVVGDHRHRLSTHEWVGGVIDPVGHLDLSSFRLLDGVPRWRWSMGDVTLEMEIAVARGRSAVGVVHRVVRAPGPVRLELGALCTWRDVHGERFAAADPDVDRAADGFVFEGRYRVDGPGFMPGGEWYRSVRHREEAERGLNDHEDLWFAGRFTAELRPGDSTGVRAWAGDLADPPPPADDIVAAARARARSIALQCQPDDVVDAALAVAADQFVVTRAQDRGPTVVAGYPWFGDWSRDTMTSYEGLFLETRRWEEGRGLLHSAAASISDGMLANTADTGTLEYNTVDAALWFVHAVGRHVARTGDTELAAEIAAQLDAVVRHHLEGTRFGIRVDPADELLTQGAPGIALTWMDARIAGHAVTPRIGKAVEINALWINALGVIRKLGALIGQPVDRTARLHDAARSSFASRFVRDGGSGRGLFDVVDGPAGYDASMRPNQLLAVSLPHGPIAARSVEGRSIVDACSPLLTSIGLRSLIPEDPAYRPQHRGGPAERDSAYHQGTVWPWLLGPYAEAVVRSGVDAAGLLDDVELHLGEWGLGSVSETADGAPPHAATGCPFQAWSVAEVFRARRLLRRGNTDQEHAGG